MRIAVAGFVHETNTFAPFPTTLADFCGFDGAGLARGGDVFAKTPPKVSLQGFAAQARAAGHELVPLLHAHAQPAAHVTREAFETICGELVAGLTGQGPWDAVFLELHGAMVAEHVFDADAEILRRVRDLLGGGVPIAVTLDSHANVGEELVTLADALAGYRTYPHIDMYETGERAYRLLEPLLGSTRRHAKAWRALPFLLPINLQTTMKQPCAGLYETLAALEAQAGAGTCLSFMTGFPLADVPQCHPCVFGYGPEAEHVRAAVDRLHAAVCEAEDAFVTHLPDAGEAVRDALADAREGTLVLADVQDNAGGGATSDTAWIIDALLEAGATDALVGLVFDEGVARQAHEAGIGAVIDVQVGGKLMPGHSSTRRPWTVEGLHTGEFELKGPMLAGGRMDLGRMAQLRHGGVRVVVTSRRTWYVERECFRICGTAPESHRIVVVKSTNHYRADFTPIAARILEFAAPAAVAMDPATLPYRWLGKGMRLHGGGPVFAGEDTQAGLRRAEPLLWLNASRGEPAQAAFRVEDVAAAAARFRRFAPLLQQLFPDLQVGRGEIESPLIEAPALQQALGVPRACGRLLVKCDHLLPVAGSIKARGGVHEVLEFAEKVAGSHGLLRPGDDHGQLGSEHARRVFGEYLVAVGSTGNLGLSIGVTAAALGFRTAVHMSAEAKAWKKDRLRRLGVTVVEHPGDYQAAVAAGRAQAQADPMTHFVDDERSASLLLGYAAAVPHLLEQLGELGVRAGPERPVFVYLPCGVGGAPGGITLGLALLGGPGFHPFFAEPVQSPCFAVKMLDPSQERSVYDLGLTNATEADGLAVPQASELAARVVAPFLSGGSTVTDERLFEIVAHAHRTQSLRLEPSAAAGFDTMVQLVRSAGGREYLRRHGLDRRARQATHLVWTTGGAFVPDEQFSAFLSRGEALLRV